MCICLKRHVFLSCRAYSGILMCFDPEALTPSANLEALQTLTHWPLSLV